MQLLDYRNSDSEQQRTLGLMKMISSIPDRGESVLDIGARDGYFSMLLTEYFNSVTALDLTRPTFTHENICCVEGDITRLDFEDDSFDFLFCAEVLEHIPPHLLEKACSELIRVARKYLLIGVPYKQDIRFGRTTCYSCGAKNPPWGHVNSFDRQKLVSLFPDCAAESISFVGENAESTNALSAYLMNLAGNPYGTYDQEETYVYCRAKLKRPPARKFMQKVLTRSASYIRECQMLFHKSHPNWIHVVFKKKSGDSG